MIIKGESFKIKAGVDSLNPGSNSIVTGCKAKAITSATRSPISIPHWDWWQGIPRVEGKDNRQYLAALLENIIITDNVIDGRGTTLQCIFSIDGRINNIVVTGNTLDTAGDHKITLGGVVTGMFADNVDFEGNPVPAMLEPLRIGGSAYVLSFSDPSYDYKECTGYYIDNRRVPFRKIGDYYIDFDLDGFLDYVDSTLPAKGSGNHIGSLGKKAAAKFGTLLIEEVKMNKFKLSKEGRQLVIEGEGLRRNLYRDINGHETIGIGHKITDEEKESGLLSIGSAEVEFYDKTLTLNQVYQLFHQDSHTRVKQLNKLINDNNLTLEQHEFDALFDMLYNIGQTRFVKSTFWRRILTGDMEGVPDAIGMWNKSRGKFHQGMANRRERCIAVWQGYGIIEPYPVEDVRPSPPLYTETVPSRVEQPIKTSLPKPDDASKEEVDYHESQWASSTIRNITFMLATSMGTLLVSKFGLPPQFESLISTGLVEISGALLTMYLANQARRGRISATKRIKQ